MNKQELIAAAYEALADNSNVGLSNDELGGSFRYDDEGNAIAFIADSEIAPHDRGVAYDYETARRLQRQVTKIGSVAGYIRPMNDGFIVELHDDEPLDRSSEVLDMIIQSEMLYCSVEHMFDLPGRIMRSSGNRASRLMRANAIAATEESQSIAARWN